MNELLNRNEISVDGMHRLGAVIERSGETTVFKTEFGEQQLPAVIKIRERGSQDTEILEAEILKARWQHALELSHPNLLKIYATGATVLNDVPIVYVVTERADESLENVLAERALTVNETREMLVPAVTALKYLHKSGYAHSRLSPSSVLAVNDQLKLSADTVAQVDNREALAEDMRALGVLIVQALTQKVLDPDAASDPDLLSDAPQPFPEIVRHCLDPDPGKRLTAEQVEAALNPPPPPAPPPVVPARTPQPEPLPPLDTEIWEQEEREAKRLRGSQEGRPGWLYAALGAAILLLVFTIAAIRKQEPAPGPAAAPAPVVAPQAPVAKPASQPVVLAQPAKPEPPSSAGRKANGWSVIVATYASREAAEKRMRAMIKRWPHFQVTVFQPQSEKEHYVVALGQDLSEDQAEAVRKRAVGAGLPRDTYIKRGM
ncbi:MAG TPA: hypothetical protein VNH18_09265 [Bryobacteraceae bacterium]|nr:hypothetical protein [Bryobacteraceae bacterium]